MKSWILIFAILTTSFSHVHGEEGRVVAQRINLEGIKPEQQLQMQQLLEAEVKDLKTQLDEAKEEIKDGKLYYNIGNIGSIITGLVGVASLGFIKIKSAGNFRERMVKTHFAGGKGSCFEELAQEVFDARLLKYENKIKSRGRFLQFRRLTEEQVNDAMKSYRADLKVDMTLTEDELEQKVKEYGKRKKIAWWTLAVSAFSFGGLMILRTSNYDKKIVTEEEKEKLSKALERKEHELHLMNQTLLQFAQESDQ